MVRSVSPIRCETVPRWLTRGMFSSVGWLPFLNCAPAFPAKTPSPATRLKTHFQTFRMIMLSPLRKKLSGNLAGPAPALHPNRDRRFFWRGVSMDVHLSSFDFSSTPIAKGVRQAPYAESCRKTLHCQPPNHHAFDR